MTGGSGTFSSSVRGRVKGSGFHSLQSCSTSCECKALERVTLVSMLCGSTRKHSESRPQQAYSAVFVATNLVGQRSFRLGLYLESLLKSQINDEDHQQALNHKVPLMVQEIGWVQLSTRADDAPKLLCSLLQAVHRKKVERGTALIGPGRVCKDSYESCCQHTNRGKPRVS